jgi:hypothetical protein
MSNYEALLAQKQYIVLKLDEFLNISWNKFEDHLERVAKRYVESLRLDSRRIIELAAQEAALKYPLPND